MLKVLIIGGKAEIYVQNEETIRGLVPHIGVPADSFDELSTATYKQFGVKKRAYVQRAVTCNRHRGNQACQGRGTLPCVSWLISFLALS